MATLTPRDVFVALFGVRTPDEHRASQAKFLRQHRRGVVPHKAEAKPTVVLESDGALRLKCACGDYPTVDPASQMACCFNCGLIYEHLDLPEGEG